MADAGSGVSGSGSSQNSADSARQSQAAADAAEAAKTQEAQMAAGLAAVNATPTPGLMGVTSAPIDTTISTNTLAQLSTMSVSTPTLSSIPTLGGIPTSYAAVALSAPPTPTPTPLSFTITGYNTPDVASTPLGNVNVNMGLSFPGAVDTTLAARMGLDPASLTLSGKLSTTNDINSFSVMGSINLGGPNTPSYSVSAASTVDIGNLNTVNLSGLANFGPNGFQSANVTAGVTHSFDANTVSLSGFGNFGPNGFQNGGINADYTHSYSDTVTGTAALGTTFDANGITGVSGAIGLGYKENGASIGLSARGSVDTRTGAGTGRIGINGKFNF
ncbi:hypothetical protein [Lysobacter gummosus]|uniref:hypothetical protein n=1 Tax=Lysobacter gummosus TaxID=262324 RepID=UPI0036263E95